MKTDDKNCCHGRYKETYRRQQIHIFLGDFLRTTISRRCSERNERVIGKYVIVSKASAKNWTQKLRLI